MTRRVGSVDDRPRSVNPKSEAATRAWAAGAIENGFTSFSFFRGHDPPNARRRRDVFTRTRTGTHTRSSAYQTPTRGSREFRWLGRKSRRRDVRETGFVTRSVLLPTRRARRRRDVR